VEILSEIRKMIEIIREDIAKSAGRMQKKTMRIIGIIRREIGRDERKKRRDIRGGRRGR
jgi:hypothetical protein